MADTDAAPAGDASKDKDIESDKKPIPTYGLVRFADLPEDTKPDIIDVVTGAVERYITDLESACKTIKETMDRIYGPGWHCIVGETFAYDVTYDVGNLLYMFFNGNLGILVWKCA